MANYKAKKAGQTLAAMKKLEAPSTQWRQIQFWMRDGSLLCKFINKLRESRGLPLIKYQGNAHVPLVAMENIDTFNRAAVEYGLPQTATFSSSDLYDAHKATFVNVIACINSLGNEANKNGFSPVHDYVEWPKQQANDIHT